MNAIVLHGADRVGLELLSSAVKERDDYLAEARGIAGVTDNASLTLAVESATKLRRLTKAIESGRTTAKAPVLDIGRRIDALAKEFVRPAEAEESRLLGMVSRYQSEQARIAAEAERKRQEELRKAEEARQKAEAELRARQAELDRIQREKERAAREADAKATEAARLAELAARRAILTEQLRATGAETVRIQAAAAVVSTPVKPSGTVARKEPRFEVTDLYKLVDSNRTLVRIEPNASAIISAIRGGMTECAGLKIWWEETTTLRV